MEINKIKYFKVVYETKSIRRAAELLKMSPGSLSKSIKSLEDELELQLFKSDGRNITPTDSGKKTYSKALLLLKSYNEFKDDLTIETQSTKTLRIATWEVFSTYLVSSLCNTEKDINELNLLVLEKTPSELEKSILNDEADIGISYEPIPHPELEFTRIKSFKFGVYCAKHVEKNKGTHQIPFAVPVTVIQRF